MHLTNGYQSEWDALAFKALIFIIFCPYLIYDWKHSYTKIIFQLKLTFHNLYIRKKTFQAGNVLGLISSNSGDNTDQECEFIC